MVYNKNFLALTLTFFIQLITRGWSLPLQDKIKIMRSLRDGRHSNNEIKRFKRSSVSYSAFLYARHTNKFIRVTKDEINALAPNQNDKHAELILEQRGPGGRHSIKGKESERYICMNSKGKVVLKSVFDSLDCTFIEVPNTNFGYITYRSLRNSKWHLGFKQKGDVRHGHRTEHHHHAAWLMMRRPTTSVA